MGLAGFFTRNSKGRHMDPYAPPPSTKILIAATPRVRERLSRVLTGHELIMAQTAADVCLSSLRTGTGW